MAELRYNPFLQDWVMIASHRQGRPQMPKDWCPFCPGSGKVPECYEVYKYDNDFPALSQEPPEPDVEGYPIYRVSPAYGKCEVILYSPEHNITLPELPVSHIRKLVNLWCERYLDISKDEKIKYIFIFENRGEMVGVTMPHPHGQIYAYSYIPKKIMTEISSSYNFYITDGGCLCCVTTENEVRDKKRIIFENKDFLVYLPFYTEYPYGVQIHSKRHIPNILMMTEDEKNSFAYILKDTTGMLDNLFDIKFPYMMCMHQTPVNTENYDEYYHFHVEFYPPMRSADRQKFNASSETGAWAPCNPTSPEDTACELRAAYKKYIEKNM